MNCPTRTAAAPSVLSPVGWCFSTASTLGRSISSMTSGTADVRMTAVTASPALARLGKTARNVTVSPVGRGTSRTVAAVTTPSVPSDPTNSRVRS